jgi:hypothetical protein
VQLNSHALHVLASYSVQTTRSMSPMPPSSNPNTINLDIPFLDPEGQPASGLVMEQREGGERTGRDIWKLNAVMALICCWVAMTLTAWGTIEDMNENQNAANPTVGRVNMAMLGVSQWIAIGLYSWTLLAPQLFPDRDFS